MTRFANWHCRRGKGGGSWSRTATGIVMVVAVVGGLVTNSAAATSGTAAPAFTVTATANPASGSGVHPGETVTYTLKATNRQAEPNGATVVDDLSGLLGNANVASTPA